MSRKEPEKPREDQPPAERRRQRLAEALRANLKRRKAAQADAARLTESPKTAGD